MNDNTHTTEQTGHYCIPPGANILYLTFDGPVPTGVVNRMMQRVWAGKSYVVNARPETLQNLRSPVEERYLHHVLLSAEYGRYIYAQDCPPVDERLLISLRQCESAVIKMMERHDHQPTDYESRMRLYFRHVRYWNYMLDRAEINAVVFLSPPHEVYDFIIYNLCKLKSVPVAIAFIGPLAEYVYFFQDIYDHCPEVLARYKELSLELKDTPIEKIDLPPDFKVAYDLYSGNGNKTPYYMHKKLKTPAEIASLVVRKPVGLIRKITKNGIRQIASTAKFRFSQYLRSRATRQMLAIYESLAVQADFSKPYVYFPLHYQPEITTSPNGGVFVWQLLAAQMISWHLPENVLLYVKEHPFQEARCRDVSLYYDLLALPNVNLVKRSTDTYQLLEHCVAVASVTGTAGFEGMFMGKPFLMFGSFINMQAPGTFNIRNNEDCKNAIDHIFKNGPKHTLKDMKIYLKSLSETEVCASLSYEVPVDASEEESITRVEQGLLRVLNEQFCGRLNKNERRDNGAPVW